MTIRSLVTVAVLAVLFGCASSSDLTAEMNPAYADTTYARVLIVAEAPDREWRESLEASLVAELSRFNVAAIPASATPGGVAGATDMDGIVVVNVGDTGVREQWVQQRAMTNTMTSNTLVSFGGSVAGSSAGSAPAQCKTAAQNGGGFMAETPWAVIAISLVDRETGDVVWKSTVEYEGEVRSDFEDLRSAWSRTVARKMSRDGLW